MSKNPTQKPKKKPSPALREENPRWLTADPVGARPAPPIQTKADALPLLGIPWQNFERLCRKLAERSGAVEKAWCYGGPGHAQRGIDVLVRMKDGTYEVWQSKRHKKFGPAQVMSAVNYFLKHDWAEKATRFVLALACPLNNDPKAIDALEEATRTLRAKGIAFEPVGCLELTEQLRGEPEIIDDFFGRAWVEEVCGADAIARLADRLSRFDIEGLRTRLRDFYGAWIAIVDPGLPIAGQDKDGQQIAAPKLVQRYVLPDLVMNVRTIDQAPDKPVQEEPPARDDRTAELGGNHGTTPGPRSQGPRSRERLLSVDQFMASEKRSVITAEAGAGKTTLLRYLALDILSDAPDIEAVRHHYAGYIPVWVPFALWARMAEGKDHPPPLEDVVHGFIVAQNDVVLADDMRRALATRRIILLVDGLDEARGSTVPDTVLAGLTTFAEMRNVPVIATSRPHGMKALSGIGGNWTRLQLAPLSEAKRDALALLWYRILERSDLGASAADTVVETQAQHRTRNFATALAKNAGIARLSFTPLFLVALLKLHRAGRDLPRNRFEASKEIVDQLLEHQPKRRAKDSVETKTAALDTRLRDRLLDDFAYGLHAGELRGAVADGGFETDAVARAAKIIMARTGNPNLDLAEDAARTVFSFSEESAGLLVKKAPDTIGFLHRLLQEYLVARKVDQFSLAERIEFIKARAAQPVWSEPILYLLYLETNEQEVGQLLTAIEEAPASGVAEQAVRDALLTEAVFADFSHELQTVRHLADRLFNEAELFAWGARHRQLLSAVTDGLFSQSLSGQCSQKLTEWIPDFHGSRRAGAVQGMRHWDKAMRAECMPYLLRTIAGENNYVWRESAQVLAEFAGGDQGTKDTLLQLLRKPRSADAVQAALVALGLGWKGDADVAAIAENLRESGDDGIRIDAIRIRAARDEADLTDLEIFAPMAFGREERFSSDVVAPDLVSYFGKKYKAEVITQIESALANGARNKDQMSLVGSLIAVDPTHRLVDRTLSQILSRDYAFHDLFAHSNVLSDKVTWSRENIGRIEAYLNKERFAEHVAYRISKSLPLPFVKEKLLASLKEKNSLAFWSAHGLVDSWGKADPEVVAAFQAVLDGPAEKIAYVAEYLPDVIDDKAAIRAAILRAFASRPERTEILVTGVRKLGVMPDDEELFRACYEADSLTEQSLYPDMWRRELINTFPSRPEIRELAMAELGRRDGNIGAISHNFGNDAKICARILGVVAPLPTTARLALVNHVEGAAQSSDAALTLLDRARFDTDGTVCGTAIMGWSEVNIAKGHLDKEKQAFLVEELDAIGPEYDHRRAAGLIGLGMADRLEAFATAKDRQGQFQSIRIGSLSLLSKDDRYIRRLLPLWGRFATVLGGDNEVLQRLELSAETCLSVLNPGVENADHVFELMTATIPTARHVKKYDHVEVVARFRPGSDRLRELIMPIVLTHAKGYGQTNADTWAAMVAADLFADQFASDPVLLRQVIDSFQEDPTRSCAAAALAEVTLRRHEPDIVNLLRDRGSPQVLELAAAFKALAAVSTADRIVDALFWLLEEAEHDRIFWNCAYWAPSLLRRIERDPDVGDRLIQAVEGAPSASAAISLLALAGGSSKGRVKHRAFFAREMERVAAATAPPVGYDVTSSSNRLAQHVLHEILT
ncbi:NACHT domain-containing protein [Bradyrhizobium liaoningense]|uniref:NACHT domain-containing protein n=1 Tax=Bradyrhizobium liaoningense TaxID=43992 RepID=UPI001BA930BA|nr:NACHT domain-containing protein [Bradyrhizobium liaoningense]MBR0840481.1 NACHT domain-containing protein [Bradyrhizobium liaoningense]